MFTAPTAPSIKFIISKRMRPTLLKRSVKLEWRSFESSESSDPGWGEGVSTMYHGVPGDAPFLYIYFIWYMIHMTSLSMIGGILLPPISTFICSLCPLPQTLNLLSLNAWGPPYLKGAWSSSDAVSSPARVATQGGVKECPLCITVCQEMLHFSIYILSDTWYIWRHIWLGNIITPNLYVHMKR